MPADSPYGLIAPAADQTTGLPLLQLPPGFTYRSLSWSGDIMSNGQPTPPRHDGMAVVGRQGDDIVLIRNHENGIEPDYGLIGAPSHYDGTKFAQGHLSGGNTILRLRGNVLQEIVPALGGTSTNCCGGRTPWGTWLTCEETLTDYTSQGGQKHGYVFEVSSDPAATTGRPIIGMGRMRHEAAAVDPRTGIFYLTEDGPRQSGFYRFVPTDTSGRLGSLGLGGRLFMARVVGMAKADLLTPTMGQSYRIDWVEIAEPDADPASFTEPPFGPRNLASGPFAQGRMAGGLRISRGEGVAYNSSDGNIYLVDTAAGRNGLGQAGEGSGAVWRYDPVAETLTALFVSPDAVVGNMPDNIAIGPRGGIVLCEDGGGVTDKNGFGNRLLGLTAAGAPYAFAKNNIMLEAQDIARAAKSAAFIQPGDYRAIEFCGATFDPAGEYLFANIQIPGITFAITGPWQAGNL